MSEPSRKLSETIYIKSEKASLSPLPITDGESSRKTLFFPEALTDQSKWGPCRSIQNPTFIQEINEDTVVREYRSFEDNVLKNIKAAFNTDKKMALFMGRCAEPFVRVRKFG